MGEKIGKFHPAIPPPLSPTTLNTLCHIRIIKHKLVLLTSHKNMMKYLFCIFLNFVNSSNLASGKILL